MAKRFLRLGILVLTLLVGFASVSFAGDFATVYHGGSSAANDDTDADTFKSEMQAAGWTSVYWASNETGSVNETDLLVSANNADIVYYSTHGYSNGYQWHMRVLNGSGAQIGRIYPSASDAIPEGWTGYYNYIGDNWLSQNPTTGYYTDTKWNGDLEWVILASCNQIEDRSGDDGALKYARTMLGSNHRVHQILGYHDAAPGNSLDYLIADKFVDYADSGSYYIKRAWELSNEFYNNRAWAVLYHSANVYDKLNDPTADTSRYLAPSIYMDCYGPARLILSEVNPWTRILAWLQTVRESIFGKREALAASTLRPARYEVSTLAVSPELVNSLVGDVRSERSKPDGGKVYLNGAKTLETWPNGTLLYSNDGGVSYEPTCLDRATARLIADQFVSQHGGIPADVGAVSEFVTYRRKSDVVANEMGKPEPLSFVCEYERVLDGIPFDGHGGNRIVVEVNDSGVVTFLKSWPKLLGPQELDFPIVSIGEAMRMAEAATGGPAKTAKLVYYGGRPDIYAHIAEPTWEVECETGDKVFVSALTGEMIQP